MNERLKTLPKIGHISSGTTYEWLEMYARIVAKGNKDVGYDKVLGGMI